MASRYNMSKCRSRCCEAKPFNQYLDLEHYRPMYEDLHAHPELSFQEARTAKKIQSVLETFGTQEIFTNIGGHGVAAVFRNGPGKTILLRTDMDGLPILEQTGLTYASHVRMTDSQDNLEKPMMHACGHDMHMTCLLAATEVLVKHLPYQWTGTLVTVYQPAEERGTGAKAMVEDGLYDKVPRPDILLDQHVVANLPAGRIGLQTGVIMASADSMRCKLIGRGSHASQPHRAINTGLLAANVIVSLQQIVSREVRPGETVVVSAVPLSAGVAENVIPAEVDIGIDTRTMNPATRFRVWESVQRIITAQSNAAGFERPPETRMTRSFPLTDNTVDATLLLQKSFKESFEEDFDPDLRASMIAEDFPNLVEDRPYVFWHLGCGDAARFSLDGQIGDKPPVPMKHTAEFSPVVDPTTRAGIHALVIVALTFLNRKLTLSSDVIRDKL